MVAITGNVATNLIGRDSFQEVDITGVTMPITKHNYIVKDINRLAGIIREAFEIANSGRPGPVLIDIPKDIQTSVIDYEPVPIKKTEISHEVSNEAINRAIDLIKKSKKPFIYTGGGVIISDATKELSEFAEAIDSPVGSSMMGISAMDAQNPRFLGMTGMHGKFASNRAMANSDLIIAIGTRFSDRATGNKHEFCKGRRIIHIDIDPAEIGKNIPACVSLLGDVKKVLSKLNAMLEPMTRPEWRDEVEQIKDCPDSRLEMDKSRLNPQSIIECVNGLANPNTIIATDVGQHQMWTTQYYKFSRPRTFITSGGLGTMGFGMGAAIGACIGTERKTVLFTSDGCFHMNMNEMATAVTNNLPIVVVLMNNNALGMVRQWQSTFFGKRYSNTTLNRKTDYVALAKAFGADAKKICTLDEMEETLKWAFEQNGPILIEAVIDSDEKVLPFIPPNCTINDIILKG
jgi:acetolactate synthase-1/2/3 large subunit